jgi:AcrR family transcriptional regulator
MPSQAERRAATQGMILESARRLFAERGFEATSIDDIAEAAGVAKGAVYHHFASKEALFAEVLEGVQAELASAEAAPGFLPPSDPVQLIALGVLHYLLAASEPAARRILLIDGPAVIGWREWREIDDRYFGAGTRAVLRRVLGESAAEREVDILAHLLMGAVMEAALICATADDPRLAAHELSSAVGRMVEGLRPRAEEA